MVRSNDSGRTFFGDPTLPASLNQPRRVSDPRLDDPALTASRPILDGSDDGSGTFFVWSLLAWSDRRSGGLEALIDARAEEGTTPELVVDWNDPPASSDVVAGGWAPEALVLVPNPINRPPDPEWHLLAFDETPNDGVEI